MRTDRFHHFKLRVHQVDGVLLQAATKAKIKFLSWKITAAVTGEWTATAGKCISQWWTFCTKTQDNSNNR